MKTRRIVAVLTALSLFSCSNEEPAEAPDIVLRAGFVHLYQSKGAARRNTSGWGQEGRGFVVSDVAVESDRILIAGADVFWTWTPTWHLNPDPEGLPGHGISESSRSALRIYSSRDGGHSWSETGVSLHESWGNNLGPTAFGVAYSPSTGEGVGLFYLGYQGTGSSGGGDVTVRSSEVRLAPLDVETGITGELYPLMVMGNVSRQGDVIAFGNSPVGWPNTFFGRFDLRQQAASWAEADNPFVARVDRCPARYFWLNPGGGLVGLCARQDAQRRDWSCLAWVDTTDLEDVDEHGNVRRREVGCVLQDELGPGQPAWSTNRAHHMLVRDDGFWFAYEHEGRVYLMGRSKVDGSILPETFDLGPGKLEWTVGFGIATSFPSIVVVREWAEAGDVLRFYRITPDTPPVALDIPTPCTGNDACKNASVIAIHALRDGRLMVVYQVMGNLSHIVLGFIPDPAHSAPPQQSCEGDWTPTPATALERQCWAHVVCHPQEDANLQIQAFEACVSRWSRARGTNDLPYQRFLAAPSDDCAQLWQADPESARPLGAPLPSGCTPACLGDVMTCQGTTWPLAACHHFNEYGCHPIGEWGGCPGSFGEQCTPDLPVHCDGDTAVNCHHLVVDDCGSRGWTCAIEDHPEDMGGPVAVCVPPDAESLCTQPYSTHCLGNSVVQCGEDGLDFIVECARVGGNCETGHAWNPGGVCSHAQGVHEECADAAWDFIGCDGDLARWVMSVAGPGVLRQLDCSSIGGRCVETSTRQAACLP